jgi:hypothetical protein
MFHTHALGLLGIMIECNRHTWLQFDLQRLLSSLTQNIMAGFKAIERSASASEQVHTCKRLSRVFRRLFFAYKLKEVMNGTR